MVALTEQDVAAAVAGEPAGMRSVYEVLAPGIAGYLRSRGSEDPEGMTQDVFVALLPRLSGLRGGISGLRTLAFSIAHARLVDELRRRSRRPAGTTFDPDDDPRLTPSAEDHALAHLEDAETAKLLAGLSEDQRAVVALRVVGQLSLEETAEVIGKSVGAVKQLQRRGLLALRDRLQSREGVTP
jgi:RNA polymerase sigma factor (sigma-70 family)